MTSIDQMLDDDDDDDEDAPSGDALYAPTIYMLQMGCIDTI